MTVKPLIYEGNFVFMTHLRASACQEMQTLMVSNRKFWNGTVSPPWTFREEFCGFISIIIVWLDSRGRRGCFPKKLNPPLHNGTGNGVASQHPLLPVVGNLKIPDQPLLCVFSFSAWHSAIPGSEWDSSIVLSNQKAEINDTASQLQKNLNLLHVFGSEFGLCFVNFAQIAP